MNSKWLFAVDMMWFVYRMGLKVYILHQISKTRKIQTMCYVVSLSSWLPPFLFISLFSVVYHYQFRIQFINQMEGIEPSLTLSLTGTKEESGELPITLWVPLPIRFTLHHIYALFYLWHTPCAVALWKQVRESSWHTWQKLELLHEREL